MGSSEIWKKRERKISLKVPPEMWYLTKWDCQNLTKGNVFFWLQHIFFPYITPKHILRSSVFSTWKSEVFDFWKWRNRMFPFPCYSLGVELCFFLKLHDSGMHLCRLWADPHLSCGLEKFGSDLLLCHCWWWARDGLSGCRQIWGPCMGKWIVLIWAEKMNVLKSIHTNCSNILRSMILRTVTRKYHFTTP